VPIRRATAALVAEAKQRMLMPQDFDPTYVGMTYTFLAIRALMGLARMIKICSYSLHRLSSLTPSSVHNQLKL
jgi:hypothetical protein